MQDYTILISTEIEKLDGTLISFFISFIFHKTNILTIYFFNYTGILSP